MAHTRDKMRFAVARGGPLNSSQLCGDEERVEGQDGGWMEVVRDQLGSKGRDAQSLVPCSTRRD